MSHSRGYTLSAIIIVVALLAAGCTSIRVSQDYSTTANLAALRTYAWQSETQEKTGDIRIDSPLIDSRIRAAVDATLAARGFRLTTADRADFLVAYRYAIRGRVRTDHVHTGIGFGFGHFGHHGAFGVSTGTDISDYDEALLLINFIDPADGSLLWQGRGTRQVFLHTEPERLTRQINETVHRILDQFPP